MPISWGKCVAFVAAGSILPLAGGPAGAQAVPSRAQPPAPAVDFIADVQPLLARHCTRCHGTEKREGGLRLDSRSWALRGGDSGPVLTLDDNGDNLLLSRITAGDEDVRMPLDSDPLDSDDVATLTRWIEQGAPWPDSAASDTEFEHWSFIPPHKPPLPPVSNANWPHQPLDRFVLAKLDAEGLHPAPEADRYVLARRLYLDLLGLPPTPAEADEFVHDPNPDACERLVDRLLASPRYGERWARRWLDLARYADTNGYEKDRPRSIWLYRDWVIDALNADLPFDQFTIEQIAGDMLPDATESQRIATGFHRNTMINEEGGIDPEEDRFKRIVDRVGTTGATWLGLTLACTQCHSHKYDPLSQHEFYELFALLNQADEILLPVPDPQTAARRAALERQIADLEADLENRFPLPPSLEWHIARPVLARASGSTELTPQPDNSILARGARPDTDSYSLTFETDAQVISSIRLEALTDTSLPMGGPGRADNGNFVVTEFEVSVASMAEPDSAVPLKLQNARTDFSQQEFSVEKAIDGDVNGPSGWAIYSPDNPWNVPRSATFDLAAPVPLTSGSRLKVTIHHQHGRAHLLGRFRVSVAQPLVDGRPEHVRRRDHLERQFAQWHAAAAKRAVHWKPLTPDQFRSNAATLTLLDDGSLLATGDATKRDVFELDFQTDLQRITALRIDALPHPLLPGGGPGREVIDAPGDFFLSTVDVSAGPADRSPLQRATFARAAHSFARAGAPASMAIDDDEQSAWSITGGTGRAQVAVFEFQTPISGPARGQLQVVLTHAMYYPGSLGRFRISLTSNPLPTDIATWPEEIEALLLIPAANQTPEQQQALRRFYLSIAPELAAEHARIANLHSSLPAYPTTMVMQQRLPQHARTTHLYERGEFLKPAREVQPGVPRLLHDWPAHSPRDRLGFARWLVDRSNPLLARVTVNRHWAALFGTGLVRTEEDFGSRGEPPSHQQLLDWLATEFMDCNWSTKALHRMIVTSAVYRQSSQAPQDLIDRDPQNRLLARASRFRVDAELVRDIALASSGLLSSKIKGPSVFAPQPEGVTSSAFGALTWNTATDEDRYRRGLYTFSKRTAPFAAFTTFDAPTGEFCSVRRERSNTPLQALTLMNDTVFVEAAQALARRACQAPAASHAERLTFMFRSCLTRPPTPSELQRMVAFFDEQRPRFQTGELNPVVLAGGTLRAWSFDSTAEDWEPVGDCRLEAASGSIRLYGTDGPPALFSKVDAPAGTAVVRLRARIGSSGPCRLFWLSEGESPAATSNSQSFDTQPDVWHDYAVAVKAHADIAGLRLELGGAPGVAEIDRIELSYGHLPPSDVDPSELAACTALARVLLNLDATISRE